MAIKPPAKRYRILRNVPDDSATRTALYFATESERDAAARVWADETNYTVIVEEWSPEHPQDYLNLGWAAVGTVEPGGGGLRPEVTER